MNQMQSLCSEIFWVGASDRRIALFENMFPLPNGVSYNSYLILDKKTALLDTVDSAVSREYLANVVKTLQGRKLDYLVINHMEPDHCANIEAIAQLYPEVILVGNEKTFQLFNQFYGTKLIDRYQIIREQDTLELGKHTLKFFFAPMVHWPEVMFTYELTEQILFSADAFGTFGAISGNIFDDQIEYERHYMDETRRYYTNIVGKYGGPVQGILKKLENTPIKMIAPLHGPIIRENIDLLIEKYQLWSTYTPEKQGVVLVYASMYGNTANVVELLADLLAQRGVIDLRIYDVSKTNVSYLIADVFEYSNLVCASPTYNLGIFYGMESFIHELAALQVKKRKYSLIGNGSWAPMAGKKMRELFSEMSQMEQIGETFEITSALQQEQVEELMKLADDIVASL